MGFTMQLIFWGILLALIISISVGVFSAVRQYSAGDYIFTGLAYLGIAMPVFWFALMANQFLSIWPKQQFHLNQPLVYFVGSALDRSERGQPRLLPTPGVAGLRADRADHRRLEPLPTGVDARRPVGGLRAHGAGQGPAAAHGDLQALAAQRAAAARLPDGRRHRRTVRRPDHHRVDLLHTGHGPAVHRRTADRRRQRRPRVDDGRAPSSSSCSTWWPTSSTACSIRGSG